MTNQVFPEKWHTRESRIVVVLFIVISLVILCPPEMFAQVEPGDVWGHWPGDLGLGPDDPIIIMGNINVPADSTLEIDAGTSIVVVRFNTRITVNGRLIAIGDSANKIVFHQREFLRWSGFRFVQSAGNESILEWCEIKNATFAIECQYSSPTLRHNIITATNYGIDCTGSSPEIANNTIIVGNDQTLRQADGIYLHVESNATITGNRIEVQTFSRYPATGINIQSESSPEISRNWIEVNGGSRGFGATVTGIYALNSINPIIEYNIIRTQTYHTMFGVRLVESSEAILQNNTLHMFGSLITAIGIDASSSVLMIKNNSILGGNNGSIGINSDNASVVVPGSEYNNLWAHGVNYAGTWEGDPTDIIADPLLDSLTYTPRWENQDQGNEIKSPCIDAGDPVIYDPDETRSDIGAVYFDQSVPDGVYNPYVEPRSFSLAEAYPNPFNSTLMLEVTLPAAQLTKVTSFSISGRRIEDIWNGNLTQGKHHFQWSPDNLPAGEYLIRFDSGKKNEIKRVVYLP